MPINNYKSFLILTAILSLTGGVLLSLLFTRDKSQKPDTPPKPRNTAFQEEKQNFTSIKSLANGIHDQQKKELPVPDELGEHIADFDSALPTLEQLRQLPEEEKHHTPKPILLAAQKLGSLKEMETKYPHHQKKIIATYLECLRNDNTSQVLRALCLKKYIDAAHLSTDKKHDFLVSVEKRIVDLFHKL